MDQNKSLFQNILIVIIFFMWLTTINDKKLGKFKFFKNDFGTMM